MKTIIALLLLLALTPVSADKLENCTIYSNFAGTVMRLRQDNVAMADITKIVQKYSDSERKAMELVIKRAYSMSAFSTAKYKLKAIKQFKNEHFMNCYK